MIQGLGIYQTSDGNLARVFFKDDQGCFLGEVLIDDCNTAELALWEPSGKLVACRNPNKSKWNISRKSSYSVWNLEQQKI